MSHPALRHPRRTGIGSGRVSCDAGGNIGEHIYLSPNGRPASHEKSPFCIAEFLQYFDTRLQAYRNM